VVTWGDESRHEDPEIGPDRDGSPVVGDGILVIEDNPMALRLLDRALRERGFRPTCTDDPDIALAAAADHPPDLFVMDLLMSGSPGEELLLRLRAIPNCQLIPVIVWTVEDASPLERVTALLDCICRSVVPSSAGCEHQPW
jgi:two-component system OmpR family response regulator